MTVRQLFSRVRRTVVGPPRDPFDPATRQRIALVAFFAWIGLGADGMSSANYGPELGFLALGDHKQLAVYLALLTGATVFVIALGYNQVVRLFPTGGGGYRVCTSLLGPYSGLLAGVCLIVDYVLTIAISMASGIDALFSLVPLGWHFLKIPAAAALILLLTVLNLRGVKEGIGVLMPVFIGFVVTHFLLIAYGLIAHAGAIPELAVATVTQTHELAGSMGWPSLVAMLLLAYSLGGGTYTGIEAVSNNIQTLAEPRVHTGKVTMLYMACSLAFIAAGIILLYLLWDAEPVEGKTLNAVVFGAILADWEIGGERIDAAALTLVLALEAGLLFVAANTGFLGGPAVLSNMAADEWLPHQAQQLSSRLVTQNGILLMGLAALAVLILAQGRVELLVVIYSITVFTAFALTLLGMCVYWLKMRGREQGWRGALLWTVLGFVVCAGILGTVVVARFFDGGWVTLLIVAMLCYLFYRIRRHYARTRALLAQADLLFSRKPRPLQGEPPALDPAAPTAIFLIGASIGSGMHSLLWVRRLFPNHFRNFLYVRVGEVDTQSFGGAERLQALTREVNETLDHFVTYSQGHGLASKSYSRFGTDSIDLLVEEVAEVVQEFPNAIVFASKLIFENDSWWGRLLHNQTVLTMQRRLHLRGIQMVVLPMIARTDASGGEPPPSPASAPTPGGMRLAKS